MATATREGTAGAYGALLDQLRGVRWPARRATAGGVAGAHHSRMRGTSAEFTEYRPYRQGDDTRRLDWKLLARSDRAYIRLSTDRSVLGTVLLVDASASMDFPPGPRSKWAYARQLAVGLASAAHADGDPVGLAIPAAPNARVLAPRTRRGVVSEIGRTLDATVAAGSAPMAPAFAAVGGVARIAIVSDLLGDAGDLLRLAREHAVTGGEVHVAHVVAPEEVDPPARALLAADPEDALVRRPLTADNRAGYVAAFAEWLAGTAREWRAAGAYYSMVTSDEPPDRAVRRLVSPARA